MKTGLKLLLADLMSLTSKSFLLAALIFSTPLMVDAAEWPTLDWKNRWSEETNDDEIIDNPPFVAVDGVRLHRFSEMQSIAYQGEFLIELGEYGTERLHVFSVWQGGASQGEQLMAVSIRQTGIDIIGPHGQNFEKLRIKRKNKQDSLEFQLLTDEDALIDTIHYEAGAFRP